MSRVICITGMHRSGTSLAASWLQKCGLKIDNGQIIGAAEGNFYGHFEDKEFVDLQSQVILRSNGNSKGWIEFSKNYKFKEVDRKEVNVLLKEREEKLIWGWKDPRTVLFLDEWKNLIPELKFIFLWRPASEVVSSLFQRSKSSTNPDFKINKFLGYKTWLYYNTQIIKFHKANPERSLLIHINQIIEADNLFFEQIVNKFDVNLKFSPINKIVDDKLLKSKPLSLSDRFFYKLLEIMEVERELEMLSCKKYD